MFYLEQNMHLLLRNKVYMDLELKGKSCKHKKFFPLIKPYFEQVLYGGGILNHMKQKFFFQD